MIVNASITLMRRRPRTDSLDAVEDHGLSFDRSDALDLYQALATLSPVQRGVIILHYHAGLKSREIAAATGLPSSTIRFHLMLARRRLRAALALESSTSRPCGETISNAH